MIFGANVYQTAARMDGIEGYKGKITVEKYVESVKQIKNLGYEQVELILDPVLYAFSEEELKKLMQKLRQLKKDYNIKYSVHFPFWWVNIAIPEPEVRKASVRVIKNCINLTAPLQPTHFVLHVFKGVFKRVNKSLAGEKVKSSSRSRIYQYACESIEKIISELDNPDQLCIENLLNSNLEYLINLMEEYNTSFCYDIGHKYMHDTEELSFLEEYGERIKSIHAHNIRLVQPDKNRRRFYKMEDHYSISKGAINFDRVLKILEKINYQETIIIEVKRHEDAVSSARYLAEKNLL
ncbi:MAG: cobamide remodeling phosphodiesterase CbiR [Halanaerobiaceae bacterium]